MIWTRAVDRSQGNNTATSHPGYASQFILLAPTSGLFNPSFLLLLIVPSSPLQSLQAMYPSYNNPQPPYNEGTYQQPPQTLTQPPPPPSNSHPPRDRDPSLPLPHPRIGIPLNFSTGQFSGKHVRAQLIELQKADLGRKYVSISLSKCAKHSSLS
jgi:hypothetical protein